MGSTRELDVEAGDARLHCQVTGNGPLVVCAHGFPDCGRTFRELAPALAAAGYRVAVPTMRGYAPSTPSRLRRYHAAALGEDLLAVADALAPGERVALVGHDWGAVAAFAASALRPERVAALVTMAVPHLRVAGPRFLAPAQLRRSWYMARFQLRDAEARLLADDLALVDRLWRDWSPGYRCPDGEMQHIKEAIRPHARDVIGYYRARSLRTARLLAQPTRVPAIHLHGRDDGCVGAELTRGTESAYLSSFRNHLLDDCGHFLHLEDPARVSERTLDFLSEQHRPPW